MHWSDLPWRPSQRTLRQFAGLWVAFFCATAAWHALAHGETRLGAVLGGLGVAVGTAGLLWPSFIRPVFVAWLAVAFPIGWLVSRVVVVLLFALFTIVALVFRMRGRDALMLRRRADRTTYWAAKSMPTDVRSYLRQF
jgi:hypothetical protein